MLPTMTLSMSVSLGFALLLPWASLWKLENENLASLAVRKIALWSYALYLVHVNVLILVFLICGADRTIETGTGAGLTALALAISVLLCFASYRFLEGPLIRTGHRKFRFDNASRTAAVERVIVVASIGYCAFLGGPPLIGYLRPNSPFGKPLSRLLSQSGNSGHRIPAAPS